MSPTSEPRTSSSAFRCVTSSATCPTAIYTLSLHDALPILGQLGGPAGRGAAGLPRRAGRRPGGVRDRKSTRLNSSHLGISYAVFCLKKKTELYIEQT